MRVASAGSRSTRERGVEVDAMDQRFLQLPLLARLLHQLLEAGVAEARAGIVEERARDLRLARLDQRGRHFLRDLPAH